MIRIARTQQIVLLLALLLPALAACGRGPDTSAAPEIAYGQDVCDRCNMLIGDERFAAAYWTTDGVARRFDDIGGMIAYAQETGEEVDTFWVHDYPSAAWIRAETAFYVFDPGLMTPMGFGIAACVNEDEALALAAGQEGALLLSFEDLQAAAADGSLDLYATHHDDAMEARHEE